MEGVLDFFLAKIEYFFAGPQGTMVACGVFLCRVFTARRGTIYRPTARHGYKHHPFEPFGVSLVNFLVLSYPDGDLPNHRQRHQPSRSLDKYYPQPRAQDALFPVGGWSVGFSWHKSHRISRVLPVHTGSVERQTGKDRVYQVYCFGVRGKFQFDRSENCPSCGRRKNGGGKGSIVGQHLGHILENFPA
ncbi:2-oxoglutarate ferredoxin oxidoreductase subunit gamma [Anopheles sinensis]|uniref:2-oxoglutarate ferredoxin oxidoreductase subunit gamma n=1 Tax=Anopheles sinensis TaxID=74873 RepID=A0A084VJL4_ANOSI|nr:2-oxoglutarate ferredoxin oxidoreductase subunit gamma [Anopheles sinensis]